MTGAARTPLLPDVPSMAEAGFPAIDVVGIWGFIAPTGVPPEIMARLHALLIAPAREEPLRAKLVAQGYAVVASSPADYAAQFRRDVAQWRAIVAKAGITPE